MFYKISICYHTPTRILVIFRSIQKQLLSVEETTTVSHNSLSLCEIYHSIIRRVYINARSDYATFSRETRQELEVHAVKNAFGHLNE